MEGAQASMDAAMARYREVAETALAFRVEPQDPSATGVILAARVADAQGKTGTFVAMPSRRRKDGEYQDIAHPITNEARDEMERIILDEYRKERERAKVAETPNVSER
jgi:DNA-binding cell septation regulator SpoVG